jgi:hypothetical protein
LITKRRTVSVTGPLGDSIIEIKGGRVHMKDSPCPDKLCVQQGWTDRGAIICLPNKVVISLKISLSLVMMRLQDRKYSCVQEIDGL